MANASYLFFAILSVFITDESKYYAPSYTNNDNFKYSTQYQDTLISSNFDHYQTKSGVLFGIWPDDFRWDSVDQLSKLKNKYGFNYLLIYLSKNRIVNAQKAGYNYSNILLRVEEKGMYVYTEIKNFGKPYAYYFDEPLDTPKLTRSQLVSINKYCKNYSENSKFIVGLYKYNCNRYAPPFDDYSDLTRYSSYDYLIFPPEKECMDYNLIPQKFDNQIIAWKNLQTKYKERNNTNWISSRLDKGEFFNLLSYAKDSLEFSQIWFFEGDEPINDFSVIEEYCEKAWETGWLDRYDKNIYSLLDMLTGKFTKFDTTIIKVEPKLSGIKSAN